MNFTNIASYLPAMARQQPDTLAVAIQHIGKDYELCTYRELDEASDRIARGLQEIGVVKGTRTVLMVKPSLEFFALVFALFKVGAVMVAVDPGIGIKNLGKCLAESEPEAFIGIRSAHIARMLFGWAKNTININVIVKPGLLACLNMKSLKKVDELGAGSNKASMNETLVEEAAAILFTSGSTGVPKGVNYSHGNFIAQVKALQNLYQIQPGEIDLATFPLFALYAPAMGMTSIIPEMDFTRPGSVSPPNIFSAIQDFSATTMFGSPALLDRVGKWGVEHNKKLPSLKRVLSAGAPVAPRIIEQFSQLLSNNVEVFTPYGATESLPVSSIGSKEVLEETGVQTAKGKGVCVGLPVEGMKLFIIRITDDVIASWNDVELLSTGEIGEIVVQAEQVTSSYYNRQHSTELAKIVDGEGNLYHRMGDLGYRDGQGRIWFCGRKSERVVTDDTTYFTVCCEGVFNVHSQVKRTALVCLKQSDQIKPGLCVELEADCKTDEHTIKNELLRLGEKHEHTKRVKDIFFHSAFPVDIRHNAKIGRAKLSQWAQKKLK